MNVSKHGCPRTPAAGAVSSYRLSPRGCCTLWCVGHLTATTVRVGAFVSGVRNSEEFAEGKHEDQRRSA
jgi:hypothetical protein